MVRRLIATGAIAATAALTPELSAATIAISPGTEYQTFEGFGGAGSIILGRSGGDDTWDQAGVDLVVKDLGITILRLTPSGSEIEPTNDNADPNSLDMSKLTFSGFISPLVPYMKALKLAGLEKVFFSVLSPPGWMKTNGNENNGGSLSAGMYEEFGEHFVAWVKQMEQQGVPLYAISLANEPRFAQSWPSILMPPADMREALKAVGRHFEGAGVATKIIWGEDVTASNADNVGYINTICNDTVAKRYASIFGVHYEADTALWRSLAQRVHTNGKSFWGTEMNNGATDTWADALVQVGRCFAALKNGINAYILWRLSFWGSDATKIGESLVINGHPGPRYYAMKCFTKYIRPGTVQIGSTSSSTSLDVVAFNHKANQTLTIVVINRGAATTATLSGVDPSVQFNMYRSSSSENFVSLGTMSASAPITLPASSVTTLYSTDYTVSVTVPASRGRAVAVDGRLHGMTYDLSGRLREAGQPGAGRTSSARLCLLRVGGAGRMQRFVSME
jgi:O-glycosyl hydrolase